MLLAEGDVGGFVVRDGPFARKDNSASEEKKEPDSAVILLGPVLHPGNTPLPPFRVYTNRKSRAQKGAVTPRIWLQLD
jgi:hypothetical protein